MVLAESLIIHKIQYIVINYINLFVFDDEIEMKNRSTNESGPFIHETEHETGSGTCNTLGKNTKQTFILLLVPRRSSCSKYATRGQGLLWLPKSRSQKNRQVPFSGASFESQEPV
jgi:hypothetical protein